MGDLEQFQGKSARGPVKILCCAQDDSVGACISVTRGTVAGKYGIRRLQVKRSGRLGQRAVLTLACCLSIT